VSTVVRGADRVRGQVEKLGYVWRVVEHTSARARALAVFKTAIGAAKADAETVEGY
jgi:hypothetical protein